MDLGNAKQPETTNDNCKVCSDVNAEIILDRVNSKVKVPRRLVHCSDGIVEEYSTDDEEEDGKEPPQPPVDTSKLTWKPYLWHYTLKTAMGGLAVCDYLGKKLDFFFGITTPKYQYAISELERLKEEEKKEKEQKEEERAAEEKIFQDLGTPKQSKLTVDGAPSQGPPHHHVYCNPAFDGDTP